MKKLLISVVALALFVSVGCASGGKVPVTIDPKTGAVCVHVLDQDLCAGNFEQAAVRLREALDRDARYSAAWKLLGKALSEGGQAAEALAAYEQGISVAEARGDLQAAREMGVFARRLRRQLLPTKR